MFDAEIMINDVETTNQGDHQYYQQSVDVDDIVHQGGLQVESVVFNFPGEVPLEDEEGKVEVDRKDREEDETLPGRVIADLLQQVLPPVESDQGTLGQEGNPPVVHLTIILTITTLTARHDIYLAVFVDVHGQVAAPNQVGRLDNCGVSLIFYPPDTIT